MENHKSAADNFRELVTKLSTQHFNPSRPQAEMNAKRPVMITDVAQVPTSEHVAQIVGKSGAKIKYLRSETNTCIKTPMRGDDPTFIITGQPDDVERAKKAINEAAQHFTELMASRSNTCAPGEVTTYVYVPQQYVGVVVGRGGSEVIRIKKQTNTRINTPKNDVMSTAFEVTGSKVNVIAAKEAIDEKVRQAYQLRSSSCFDPNLTANSRQAPKYIANWSAPSTPLYSTSALFQTSQPLPFATSPTSSTIIRNKSDQTKSLLVKTNDTIGMFCDNYANIASYLN